MTGASRMTDPRAPFLARHCRHGGAHQKNTPGKEVSSRPCRVEPMRGVLKVEIRHRDSTRSRRRDDDDGGGGDG